MLLLNERDATISFTCATSVCLGLCLGRRIVLFPVPSFFGSERRYRQDDRDSQRAYYPAGPAKASFLVLLRTGRKIRERSWVRHFDTPEIL
jgi:hypothetical protein